MRQDLRQRLLSTNQGRIISRWEKLSPHEQSLVEQQLEAIDLEFLANLFDKRNSSFTLPDVEKIAPVPVLQPATNFAEAKREGLSSLAKGEVGILMVAGGQGSRLGTTQPKGTWPITPITQKSLFQLHSEKVLTLSKKANRDIPFMIMTSPATHDQTVAFFNSQAFFGLKKEQVIFFTQGTMPAVDLNTGEILFEEPAKVFASPDGHGGTLTALKKTGLLEQLKSQGIRHLFFFQVDNPLVQIADPVFIGHHISHRSQLSSKVILKDSPTDKLGNFIQVDGRCQIIEYSDLPMELATRKKHDGSLFIDTGNPAIHLFDVDFLDLVCSNAAALPFHLARKKVPHLDANLSKVVPEKENAWKFERFIFDIFPNAERWLLVSTKRDEEFAPLKNAQGDDSPETAKYAQSKLFIQWLEKAGVKIPAYSTTPEIEICPSFAMDAEELSRKLPSNFQAKFPLLLQD
ncbi:MAG: UDPGP type 1 family protein [Planctomycetes bacterium]|nr:UDPGP type 1 family protein [Planctomycetota bacterium]